ncbi:MAG: sulfur reductase subunit SreC [Aquificaceae bacterium]|nr:sulfur reductase subunit SreC [Aquificaceae bacterium]MCX8059647.1 sulfur reductase subunit SreC [Aquificaceae bacterium]MDW8097508.1 sulfur reductase subunit SreC [Aquificaceae bacterium]
MHPPASLIWFFITAGISIGLFNFVYFMEFLTLFGKNTAMPREAVLLSVALSVVLIGLGAIGASFHLGHKLRAWKAIRRFHTSWLSREAVFSGAYGFTLFLYGLSYYFNLSLPIQHALGVVTFLLGWLSAFSTAMIYASNKFVLEWNTSLTVLYYLDMYLMLGSSAFLALTFHYRPEFIPAYLFLTSLFISLGLAFRIAYNVRQFLIPRPTLNEALNLAHNRPIRVLDTGSTTDNYCTTEFYYKKGKDLLGSVLPVAYILTFVVPLFLVLYSWITGNYDYLFYATAFASLVMGSFLERWCFFVEGNHVQNLFYGLYPEEGYRLRKGYMERKKTVIRL